MESIRTQEIVAAFKQIGLKPGDILDVHSRLFTLGTIEGTPVEQIPQIYLRSFQEQIGESGTVVVPTYTTSFGRHGNPFVLEKSPSEMGVLSEWVRTQPGSVRSLHPIQSLTALGGQAQALAESHPRWNVGHNTTWDRMLKAGGKVVSLGIRPKDSLSYVHQIEYLACVPYLYPKILHGKVSAQGREVPGPFFLAARYLEYDIAYDLARLEEDLTRQGALKTRPLGGHAVWCASLEAIFEVAMAGLRKDPYYLLKSPPAFVPGKIPWDGATIEREGASPQYFLA